MLVLCKILGLLIKTLTDDEKYYLLYTDNLTQPIQMLLSQKPKTFAESFFGFLKSTLNLEHSRKNDDPHCRCISQITVFQIGD